MAKRRGVKRIFIFLTALVCLWLIARFTGIIRFHSSPTSSNAPTIKPGDLIISSNLISLKRLDIITYSPVNSNETWVRRLCAMPSDTVEIIQGNLYVNGNIIDNSIELMHDYVMKCSEAMKFEDEISYRMPLRVSGHFSKTKSNKEDSCRVSVLDKTMDKNNTKRRFISNQPGIIHQSFNSAWTLDNFGPLIIPEGQIFLLGDNRHQSIDSRINGLVPIQNVTGVMIN